MAAYLSNRACWGFYFLIVIAICVSGIGYFGGVAVSETPPMVDFVTENGRVVFTVDQIVRGEEVFHLHPHRWSVVNNTIVVKNLCDLNRVFIKDRTDSKLSSEWWQYDT